MIRHYTPIFPENADERQALLSQRMECCCCHPTRERVFLITLTAVSAIAVATVLLLNLYKEKE